MGYGMTGAGRGRDTRSVLFSSPSVSSDEAERSGPGGGHQRSSRVRARALVVTALLALGAVSACGDDGPSERGAADGAGTATSTTAPSGEAGSGGTTGPSGEAGSGGTTGGAAVQDEFAKSAARNATALMEACLQTEPSAARCATAEQLAKIGMEFGSGPAQVSMKPWGKGYRVIATSTTGAHYALANSRTGTIRRSCTEGAAACTDGTW